MNLNEAMAAIERRFACEDAPALALSPTGEEFVEIGVDGIRHDGFLGFATNEEAAVDAWFAAVIRYADGKKGRRLYWRNRPEIVDFDVFLDNSVCYPDYPHGKHFCAQKVFKVYARLLITDRPVVGWAESMETFLHPESVKQIEEAT